MIPKNVLGGPLRICSCKPMTGFYRNGLCETDEEDRGMHTVCVEVTDAFLAFSKSRGNDLSRPVQEFQFPGLKAGDHWCLCASRWLEAFEAGLAPKVFLDATEVSSLKIIPLSALMAYAADSDH